jgi:23S rRNA pseudouridine2457 synthase
MRVILFNKPFRVLTRFTPDQDRPCLADYLSLPGFYPVGRLDYDSEGLLLLTDSGRVQTLISHPRHAVEKVYWAQVEGVPERSALERLAHGVKLSDGMTARARVRRIDPEIAPRVPPIRFRARIPATWLELAIREGRNRQVRRMTAAVGHPTLRLIRVAVGPFTMGGLAPGSSREVPEDELAHWLDRLGGRSRQLASGIRAGRRPVAKSPASRRRGRKPAR